ncbi:lysylphosphatidylglycerol synthase domain-containing protein [Pollutibacter soli]|uniref:lysylphosphatidylglycerol synthase domain-containing protein n=1 Tax=Pollutibacter soli TaxID=3034157 RepID=UPI003013A47C
MFAWVAWSIWQQIQQQPELGLQLKNIWLSASGAGMWKLLLVFLLMFVNWGLEARKWQVMMKNLTNLSFNQSVKSILSGIAFSMNTPNRVGEYGGRVLFIEPEKRIRAVSLTAASSFSQLLITMVMGSAGLYFIADNISASPGVNSFRLGVTVLQSVVIASTLLGFIMYFNMGSMIRVVERVPLINKVTSHFHVLVEMDKRTLFRSLTFSLIRFSVFIIQYNLMLQVMDVQLGWWQGFWTVSVLFLLLAVIPTIALLELGLRWEFSVLLFGLFSNNSVGMYAAATGIWFINLVVPAIAGSFFMLGWRRSV